MLSNTTNNTRARARAKPQWEWDVKNGRMQPRAVSTAPPRRPLFKKQPNDDYDWYIFKNTGPKARKSLNKRGPARGT